MQHYQAGAAEAELLVNAVFNCSPTQRLRLRKVHISMGINTNLCSMYVHTRSTDSHARGFNFQVDSINITAHWATADILPCRTTKSRRAWHQTKREQGSESHEMKGEVFRERFFPCGKGDPRASEDAQTNATRHVAKDRQNSKRISRGDPVTVHPCRREPATGLE